MNKLKLTKIFITVLILLYSNSIVNAHEIIWGNSVGLFGGANMNFHSATMRPNIPNIPPAQQPNFNINDNSLSGFFGIEGNFQTSKITVITARVGYNFAGIDFSHKPNATTTNTLETTVNEITISPMLKFVNVIPSLRSLYFTTGVNFGIPVSSNYNFTQQQGANIRKSAADIPDASMRISVPLGIGYIYKLTSKIAIIPEVSYNLNFSETSSNSSWQEWKFDQLKAGVSLTYMLPKRKKERPTPTVDATALSVRISDIFTLDRNNSLQPVTNIRLEEAEYGEYFPIIPHIFFEVNDTELAPKYKRTVQINESLAGRSDNSFDEIIAENAIEVNEQMLDIIAKRMQQNPNSTLTITGTIDGRVETDAEISEGRAFGVRKYLIDNYNISAGRINTRFGGVPARPSTSTVQDGIVENRRVEFTSNDPTLFEPVFVRGEKRRLATPDNIIFVPEVNSNPKTTSWSMEISQADRIVRTLSGDSIEPIRWQIGLNELTPSQLPIEYKLSVFTQNDEIATTVGFINMDFASFSRSRTIDQPDKVINKFSLVVFDFDSPVITDQNRAIIDKFIIPSINFGSTIDIYGYTDRIGDSRHNQRLATARAEAVRDYIRTRNRNVPISTYGIGDTQEIFNNNLPAGRQLSRTVQIFVVTPK